MVQLTLPEQKNRLRKVMFKRRAVAAECDSGIAGASLATRVVSYLGPDDLGGTVVSAFLPIRTEIETRPLIAQLTTIGAVVVLPTIDCQSPELTFKIWAPGDPLAKGAFDVEEPLCDAKVQDPTVLIVPLLAFDRAGYRLGYGGGYYDRAIERLKVQHPVRAIGVAYEQQEVVHVPRASHDERLTTIITPDRVIEFESE